MYMSQHRFTPVPEKFDAWVPYNWNYMTLTARAEGAVLSRILRITAEPESFFAVGLWTGHEEAMRWSESPESALGAKPSVDQGLYEGYPMEWSRWELTDFAWGLAGPAEMAEPDLSIRHISWKIEPSMGAAQERLCSAALSLLARRPGFICGETYRGHRGDQLLLIHSYRSVADWPFGTGAAPGEFQLLQDSSQVRDVLAKTATPQTLDCSAFQVVWGPEADALQEFIEAGPAGAGGAPDRTERAENA